jgi:hypothetical protein
MLAITYSMKKEIKVAKWGTPKKKIPGGGQGSEKIARGSLIFGFIAFL